MTVQLQIFSSLFLSLSNCKLYNLLFAAFRLLLARVGVLGPMQMIMGQMKHPFLVRIIQLVIMISLSGQRFVYFLSRYVMHFIFESFPCCVCLHHPNTRFDNALSVQKEWVIPDTVRVLPITVPRKRFNCYISSFGASSSAGIF